MNPPRKEALKNKNLLVTGGAGFLGSHLVDRLTAYGGSVFTIDDLSTGVLSNVSPHANFLQTDIRGQEFFDKITDNINIVYHLAAQTSVNVSIENPKFDFEVNVKGTRNVLEFCRQKDISKVIFISTAAVYGNPVYLPIDEDHPTNPISPYGKHKIQAEEEIKEFSARYGLKYVILRPFNVYGPRMKDNVVKILLDAAKNNQVFKIYGDGTQIRDFIYVTDVIDVLISSKILENEIVNVGSGIGTSLNELVNMVKEIFPNLIIKYVEKIPGEIHKSVSNVLKMSKLFPRIKIVPLKEGLLNCLKNP